jgi:orotate phosphoribosyltransferase
VIEEAQKAALETLLSARRGHFQLESGHHGDLWLDLELLFYEPARVRPFAARLAEALSKYAVDAVCGPLVEGAFIASLVAPILEVPFTYTHPRISSRPGLFPVDYVLPQSFRQRLKGRKVAIVNDVINAGSAVRGTLQALLDCDARPIAIATLAVLGGAAFRLAREAGVPVETLASLPNEIWTPIECPLCVRHVPMGDSPDRGR